MRLMNYIMAGIFLILLSTNSPAQQPAFPGAEGYGRYASGGRGGRVIEVTSLLDKDRYDKVQPGTLREALNTEGSDPITIVFRVSGIIELSDELKAHRSNMTIAGQTAPGDGICIKDASIKISGENIIVRYLRFRPGDELGFKTSGLNMENSRNFIVDHCSMSWSAEENTGFYDNVNSTIQWCIISEGLYNSVHDKGARSYGGQWGGQYSSYHHNLLAHHRSRSPRVNGSRAHDTIALVDYRNNVIFNWGSSGAVYGGEEEIFWADEENPDSNKAGCFVNFVNNYYKPGPGTSSALYFAAPSYVTAGNDPMGYADWYIAGNYMETVDGGMNDDNWQGVDAGDVGGIENIKHDTEHEVATVTTHTAQEAYDLVLANAGAIKPIRDPVDERIVAEVKGEVSITGGNTWGANTGIIDNPDEVGGWPEYLMPLEENIPVDTDKDGMPDDWETANGLDPNDQEDGKTINDDGYSNLEHYLNSDIPYIEPAQPDDVSDIKKAGLNIYPNPFKNELIIENTNQTITNVEIYDPSGKMMINQQIGLTKNSVNTSTLAAGVYMLKARQKYGFVASLLIVKR